MTDESTARTPALGRLELAAALRRYRKSARLSTQDVTTQLKFSASKISRMETGKRSVSPEDLDSLVKLYDVPSDDASYLRGLLRASHQRSVWQTFDVADFSTSEFIELEQGASSIDDYKTSTVTALLQTPEYTRAALKTFNPSLPQDVVLEQVQGRADRQRDLWGRARLPRLTFVMDEGVLHREVGGQAIMRSQLLQIVNRSQRPEVKIHIIPFSAGAHRGMDSVFTILSFTEAIRDRVYVDGLMGSRYLVLPAELEHYRLAFSQLAEMALDHTESEKLIKEIANSFGGRRAC